MFLPYAQFLYPPLPLPSFHTFTYSHAHKATVMSVNWNKNGNWLLTASRDHLIKVYDIRAMKEMYTLKGHKKDVNSKELRTTLRDALFENNKSYVSKTVWSCSQILSLSLELDCYLTYLIPRPSSPQIVGSF